jgi:C4-dicarboxylate-specific signal transduction histidine kinase
MLRPFRQQVLGVAAVLAMVVVGALLYASRMTYQEQVLHLRAEAFAMSNTVVAYLERNLESVDDVATMAARHPDVVSLRPEAAGHVLQQLVRGDQVLRNALIADVSGQVIAWATPPRPELEGRLQAEWLRGVAASAARTIGPVLGTPEQTEHAVATGYPIRDANGKVEGVLAMTVHLEAFEEVFARIPLPANSVITVTDADSVVVARSLESSRYVGRPAEGGASQARDLGSVPPTDVRMGLDGVERAYGNAVVARGRWLASVGIPTAVALERTAPIDRRNFLIMIAAFATVLGLTLLVTERSLKAVNEVGRAAERVAQGDLSPLEPKDLGSVEFNQLHLSLAGMITNLRAAQDAVAAQVAEERRVREEKESLQKQLIRQERLAAIGVLVSGVAHELNNPLQAILGFSELLQLHDGLPEAVKHDLALIRRESTRASGIIRNLQRFGRQTSEPSPVRLSDVVASVLELRQRKIEAQGIRLDIEDQSDAVVSAVFTELQQVVLNFLINAEQAVVPLDPARRRILIRTGDARNSARLEVEDYGDGVPPADEPKLFQPFFTTKPVGEGTGLGLSVSYGIINAHGGEIGYRQSPHGGAIFYFELPTR